MHKKLITADKNFPYATPFHTRSCRFSAPVALKAGASSRGVITSPTREETIAPKAPPMITPMAKSTTLPFTANSLNSFKNPLTKNYYIFMGAKINVLFELTKKNYKI